MASQASAFDVQTLVSPALAAALAAAPEDDEGAAKAFEEFLSVTERWEQGKREPLQRSPCFLPLRPTALAVSWLVARVAAAACHGCTC